MLIVVSNGSRRTAPAAAGGGGGGGFAAADLLNEDFETGDHLGVGFSNGGEGPPTWVPNSASLSHGTWSATFAVADTTAGEGGSTSYFIWPASHDEVWISIDFNLETGTETIQKWARFYTNAEAAGGLFLKQDDQLLCFCTDMEFQVNVPIGVDESILNGKHNIEVHYRKVGDATPNAGFWLDGVQYTTPDATNVNGQGAFWLNNRIYANSRNNSNGLRYMEFMGTHNTGNTRSGLNAMGRIRVSSLGRIGP